MKYKLKMHDFVSLMKFIYLFLNNL